MTRTVWRFYNLTFKPKKTNVTHGNDKVMLRVCFSANGASIAKRGMKKQQRATSEFYNVASNQDG